MVEQPAPHGGTFEVPEGLEEDIAYPSINDPDAIRAYYHEHGYVVVRGVFSPETCEQARAAFAQEVKPFDGFIYRQATANPERHEVCAHGYMLNSILNVHSLHPKTFGSFREHGTDIVTSKALQQIFRAIEADDATLVQSMYFEGNPATWAHQDTYYLDSEELGRMSGIWIAAEDISPGAGRFYVYPGSHRIDMEKNGGNFDIAFNHEQYKQLVLDVIDKFDLKCRAPALRKGDVLFWSGKTIHGSLETTTPELSRSSFTAHYIPAKTRFLQFQKRIKTLNLSTINGMQVHTAKDLQNPINRLVFELETRAPKAFQLAKKLAVKAVTK